MHIAIEGIDGVGKTTIARELARKIGFSCIEKHLHALLDGEAISDIPNYLRVTEKVNASQDNLFRAWFYALGNLYLREHYGEKDIITDRYFASNYSWNGTAENEFVFEKLIKILGKPEITFLIYADPQIRTERIRKRNPADPDLKNSAINFSDVMYTRLTGFLKKYDFHFYTIDTSDLSVEKTLMQIEKILCREFPVRFKR